MAQVQCLVGHLTLLEQTWKLHYLALLFICVVLAKP